LEIFKKIEEKFPNQFTEDLAFKRGLIFIKVLEQFININPQKRGKAEEAQKSFAQAIEKNPNLLEAKVAYSDLLKKEGKFDQALHILHTNEKKQHDSDASSKEDRRQEVFLSEEEEEEMKEKAFNETRSKIKKHHHEDFFEFLNEEENEEIIESRQLPEKKRKTSEES